MHRDRWEELVMLIVALCLLSYLLPPAIARDVIMLLLIAVLLIVLLLLRSVSWHEERTTPFDGVLIVGIFLSLIELAAFLPLQRTAISSVSVALFAAFYALMAVILARHRGALFRGHAAELPTHHFAQHAADRRARHEPYLAPARRAAPMRAMVSGPPKAHRTDHRRHLTMRPVSEMAVPDEPREHAPSFRRGIVPLHEMTSDDIRRLHPLEIFHDDIDDRAHDAPLVAKPGSSVAHLMGCRTLRATKPGMLLFIDRKSHLLRGMTACKTCKPF